MHIFKCFSYLRCMILKSSSTFRIQCEAHATALVSVTMVANDNWLYIVGWRWIYLCKYQHNHVAKHFLFDSPLLLCQGPVTWTNKAGLPSIDWDMTLWLHECIALKCCVNIFSRSKTSKISISWRPTEIIIGAFSTSISVEVVCTCVCGLEKIIFNRCAHTKWTFASCTHGNIQISVH